MRLPAATRGTGPAILLWLVCGSLTGIGGDASAPGGFRFERPALPGGKGANRLTIDPELLAGAAPLRYERPDETAKGAPPVFRGGLEDLRLFDASGHEVGYLLVAPKSGSVEWRKGKILPVASTKTESGFEIDLGSLTSADRISVKGIPSPFLKRVRLEGSGDRARWVLLVAEGTLFDLPAEKLRRTEVDFPPGKFRYFRLIWDDRSSGRVPLPQAVSVRPAVAAERPAAVSIALSVRRRPSEPGKSRFQLSLPAARLPVAALEFVVKGNLLRRAEVFEARLVNGEVVPVLLGSGTLRRAERGDLIAADVRVPVRSPDGPDLDLVVEDGSNPPFEPSSVAAELVPLPWIYFESLDGQPLSARYGAVVASAPKYDLEAAREFIGRAALSEAHWGKVRDLRPNEAAAASSPLPAVGAPIGTKEFRYSRKIPAGRPGLNALLLDAAVLARAQDLGELRIADAEARQVPYLLEKRDEPLSLALPSAERDTKRKDSSSFSRYRIRLPYATLPASRLVLSTAARVFDRNVHLAVRRSAAEAGSEAREESVARASWRHAEPELPAPPLFLELPTLSVSELELSIDEGDNSPLPLDPPRLLLPSYRVRFFYAQGSELVLLYGQPGLAAPRYDLSLLAPRLVGMSADELALAPESASGAVAEASATPSRVFWGVLILAVVFFLVLIVRLTRKGAAPAR